jgi:2-keto-4-pentenoate hydratase/2-oxohepta-3-ene-1,7-dioic acid hydratase in catechol pathway
MKICRFDDSRIGVVEGDEIIDVTPITRELPAFRWPLPHGDALIERLDTLLPAMRKLAKTGARHPVSSVRLLSPVANPGKIIGIGRSYKGHVEEAAKDPAMSMHKAATAPDTIRMFIKANTALVGPSEGVALRFLERRNDPEAEFSIIIGKKGTDIPRGRAMDYVAGYAIGLDMTLRGPELPSSRKSIDTYAVLGPWLVTPDEIPNPGEVELTLSVNGELRQRANTRDLLFSIPAIIENAAAFYTLYPGDIIMTGTPEGVAPVQPGDVMTIDAAGVGTMTVSIRSRDRPAASR